MPVDHRAGGILGNKQLCECCLGKFQKACRISDQRMKNSRDRLSGADAPVIEMIIIAKAGYPAFGLVTPENKVVKVNAGDRIAQLYFSFLRYKIGEIAESRRKLRVYVEEAAHEAEVVKFMPGSMKIHRLDRCEYVSFPDICVSLRIIFEKCILFAYICVSFRIKMENKIYTFLLIPDWKLMSQLGKTDKFGGSWESIEKREGQSLKQLKSIATVKSVGASTRIEGSSMTDDEVSVLISNLEVSMLEDRDEQEVAGYFETLDLISGSFEDIPVTESSIQSLHHLLMKHSEKDAWHRGKYKQHSNVVEATHPNGEKYIIFRTTDPGFATEDAMRQLISWYNSDTTTHPVIRSALFVYDFLSIHPFQDGNGRLSRLLATLLLLKEHYSWIQYVSFEHEIESRKAEYYKVLMDCQGKRPGEDVYPWVDFFLDCLNNIQASLLSKLDQQGSGSRMSPKEKRIYLFIESHPGARSGEIAGKLDIPLPTVKKMLAELTLRQVILKQGVGKGTYYTIV